jgi:hypothetical protein
MLRNNVTYPATARNLIPMDENCPFSFPKLVQKGNLIF